MREYKKLTLIGMPCAGKTTIGRAFAHAMQWGFIDLDEEVERAEHSTLIQVMNMKGADYFRDMEYSFLKQISLESNLVVSPAGSIIYHAAAMRWIKDNSLVVFLDTPFVVVEARLRATPRAVANLAERGLQSIWDERMPIYKKFADITIQTKNASVEQIIKELIGVISQDAK